MKVGNELNNLSAFEVYSKKYKCSKPQLKIKKFALKQFKHVVEKEAKLAKLQTKSTIKSNSDNDGIRTKSKKANLKKIKQLCDNNSTHPKLKNNNKRSILKNKNCNKVADRDSIKEIDVLTDEGTEFDKVYLKIIKPTDKVLANPINESEALFEWLIYPLKKDEFFNKNWEKLPVHITRNKLKYYKSLMSTPMLDQILRDNYVLFSKNLDITCFENDMRETHNPVGRALPSVVWDYFTNGCSVRLLNPHTYIPKLHALNSILQEYFNSFVGANSYLTPPNSQGFAPHYDDIEAFVLQIEGKKRWRLYKPRSSNEFLPRYSSSNLSEKDIGKPILDTIVNAGDLLYFPRGTIHQADTFGFDSHSLHITLSFYQKNSWGDFLEKLIPQALNSAIENDFRFRKGLPFNYLNYVGSVYTDNVNDVTRQQFLEQTKNLSTLLLKYINIDKAADELAKHHIHDFLPPVLSANERLCSVYEAGDRMVKNGVVINRVEIDLDTSIRLSRNHSVRLIEENGVYQLYYSSENSKTYHEYELQFFEINLEFVPAIKELIVQFPKYIRVEDLPIGDLDKKIQLVRDLWEKAIVISERPLSIIKS
ncbi:PREDICTED: bifunctional lysine-specific demethylase and histidyl-hydroxylase NO66 [Ceratosolen solmsi marchali]|uniref:Bifunctional lysine-specific demethylase and histidyl-hydroxylase n=1 Tax=Ceratosolen solmsi marchali TaxID=326594 RepID=A0AAJ6YWE5_9HYME|nr:PREDICTED: bifunctional lysine-specific demethylase and histidyl-hydroxylase NO66 [Ceratosolen solmsi marchali]